MRRCVQSFDLYFISVLKAKTPLAQMVIDWNLPNRKSFLKPNTLLNTGM